MTFLKKFPIVKLVAVFLAGTFLFFSTACSSATARDMNANPPQNGIYEDSPVSPPAKTRTLQENSARNLSKPPASPGEAAQKAAEAVPETAKKVGNKAAKNLKQLPEETKKRAEMIPDKTQEAAEQVKDEARALNQK